MWLRRGTGGQLVWMHKWAFEFHNMQGISRLAEELLASQEKLCSTELVGPSERWLDGRSVGRSTGCIRISESDSNSSFRWIVVTTRIPALWLFCILGSWFRASYSKYVYEYPTRCNNNILVLLQDLYMFRVPAVPIIRNTTLQWLPTAVMYSWWWVQQVLETCRDLAVKLRYYRCILSDIRKHIWLLYILTLAYQPAI
jgi:hypothetical protein